jgi:hypothetical protein
LRAAPVALRAELRDVLPDLREAISPLAGSDQATSICELDCLSVYRLIFTTGRLIVVPCAFHERAQVIQGNATVDLGQGALDDVLEIRGAERTAAIQRE